MCWLTLFDIHRFTGNSLTKLIYISLKSMRNSPRFASLTSKRLGTNTEGQTLGKSRTRKAKTPKPNIRPIFSPYHFWLVWILLYTVLPRQTTTRERDDNVNQDDDAYYTPYCKLHVLPPYFSLKRRCISSKC